MLTNRRDVTPDTLNEAMNFDSVIYSHGDGTISDVEPGSSLYGPEVSTWEQEDGTWDGVDVAGPWELLSGFSGQYGYSGLHTHASEYIGGGLARHILETVGFYVAVVITPVPLDEDDDVEPDSWAVAYTETSDA